MSKKKILVTSALPYANGPLHFGHIAGAYLPADCYARFQRLCGNDVLYICGSDEHGVAITLSAELANRSPKDHVDIYHEVNRELFRKMNFSFDHYGRTTWEGHAAPVQKFFLDLVKNGYIEARVTNQLYSEAEDKFLADRYVVGQCPRCGFEKARGDECPSCGAAYEATDLINPRSKLSGSTLVLKPTKHWFLLLDKFRERLLAWLATKDWKPNVLNFIKDYIENLRPRAITRDGRWGIPVPLPDTDGKVLYVWFDAPIGYITITMEWAIKRGNPDLWKTWWMDPETTLVHFIGKDNIPFHGAIFPAMVMGQDLPIKLVDELPANEFYKLEGRQFSKSDGWYIDLESFFQQYTPDQIRYAIAATAPETSDSDFSWQDFQQRCNGDLVGKFGNFLNRSLVFAQKQCGGVVPTRHALEEVDVQFLGNIGRLRDEARECYEEFRLRRASQVLMELAQVGNVYFDAKQPWKDAKDVERRQRMETTISCCIECIKTLALLAAPIVPESAAKAWCLLGQDTSLDALGWQGAVNRVIAPQTPLPVPNVLFQKVEDDQIAQEIATLHKSGVR